MIVCNKCGWFGNRSEMMIFYNRFPNTEVNKEHCCPNCGAQDYKVMRV